MSTYDFKAQRLFVETPLHVGARVVPTPAARNYLLNVLRLRADDPMLLFNGRDGEWRARIEMTSRKEAALVVLEQTRAQSAAGDLDYAFAPLKQARLDYMVQKAAEMGVARLIPVLTRRTQVRRVNLERLRANVIEAAEQCGLLNPPEIVEARDLADWLASLPAGAAADLLRRGRRGRRPHRDFAAGGAGWRTKARRVRDAVDRTRGRFRRGRARANSSQTQRVAAVAGTAHPARGHGGRRGPGARPVGSGRLVVNIGRATRCCHDVRVYCHERRSGRGKRKFRLRRKTGRLRMR